MQTCVQDDLYRFSVKQRVEILEHWGRLQREGNKAKPSAASEWVHIPRTEISLYSEHQSRLVGPFEIARQPVLVMEYQRFLENPEHLVERFWTHAPSNLPRETVKDVLPSEWRAQQRFPNRPVTFVNWYEAVAYCRWLTEAEGREQEEIIRLPTEHEWTAAASNAHPEKRYPWGDDPPKYGDQAQANWKGAQLGGPSPVGAFRPLRVAGGELDDIVGNVYQWSQGVASADEIAESTEIPLVGSSWDEMNLPVLQIKRVRYEKPASFRSDTIGFRCSRHLIVARSMS